MAGVAVEAKLKGESARWLLLLLLLLLLSLGRVQLAIDDEGRLRLRLHCSWPGRGSEPKARMCNIPIVTGHGGWTSRCIEVTAEGWGPSNRALKPAALPSSYIGVQSVGIALGSPKLSAGDPR